jgi:hypothetical protein
LLLGDQESKRLVEKKQVTAVYPPTFFLSLNRERIEVRASSALRW